MVDVYDNCTCKCLKIITVFIFLLQLLSYVLNQFSIGAYVVTPING